MAEGLVLALSRIFRFPATHSPDVLKPHAPPLRLRRKKTLDGKSPRGATTLPDITLRFDFYHIARLSGRDEGRFQKTLLDWLRTKAHS